MLLRKAQESAAEEKLTRAIQEIRDRYNGDLGAFFRDYAASLQKDERQRDLPLTPSNPPEQRGI